MGKDGMEEAGEDSLPAARFALAGPLPPYQGGQLQRGLPSRCAPAALAGPLPPYQGGQLFFLSRRPGGQVSSVSKERPSWEADSRTLPIVGPVSVRGFVEVDLAENETEISNLLLLRGKTKLV